jgi:1-acyl-sn-glycerol-3-phosphate acyltransferase
MYYVLRGVIVLLKTLFTRTRVVGRENMPRQGACIVVANHVNLIDSPILGVSLGRKARFMAKEEMWDSRLSGWLADQFGAFPVAKGHLDRRAGRTSLELLARGEALIIFPEGKRSPDGKMGYAYPGAAMLSVRGGAPIVPVGIAGTDQLVGKTWFFKRPRVILRIGKPFSLGVMPEEMTKARVPELTREVMAHIAAELPPEYRGQYGTGVAIG